MTINKKLVLAGVFTLLTVAAIWTLVGSDTDDAPTSRDERFAWFESGPFEVGLAVVPDTPRMGDNDLMIMVRLPNGTPAANVDVSAYAEMPAMGAMPAMRAPADLVETTGGVFEGAVDLRMRGAWPLTVSIADPTHGNTQMVLDLATDRPGLRISAGGRLAGTVDQQQSSVAATDAGSEYGAITVDNRRRQMIGLETEVVTHHDLVRKIRAVGNITYDERRLSKVTLKYDAWIGDLNANFVGADVVRGQRLFSIYSPELYAAQQEYLEALKRLSRRDSDDSLLKAARQRLKLWDIADREIAAIEERGVPLEYVPIYSPVSGTVVAKQIDSGSGTVAGQTLLEIADLSKVWVEAELYEAELDLIQEGMTATVSLSYLPGRLFNADVDYIYPYLDKTSRTGRVRLTLDNADGDLKPDMYAEVRLVANIGNRLAVPEDAVLFAGESRVVFIDLGDGRLKPVKIKTGQQVDGMIEVTDGLSHGDVIVTSGNFLIAAETKLKAGIDQW
jgi:Cu(I)/Ag(I) efflux system membrane fusion protein